MYFKLLELFILRTLFNEDEYKITSKNFNPIKIVIILFLVANLGFTIYLLIQFNKIHDIIQKNCPEVFMEKKETPKEKVIDKKTWGKSRSSYLITETQTTDI